MGYSGRNTPTPPRSFRIIIGAKLAIVCMVLGGTMVTNRYHRALSMKEQPVEMEWQDLADNGLDDNAFITLTNVQLSQADQAAYDDFMTLFDEDADAAELQNKFGEAMDDMDAAEVFEMSNAPIKIIPFGADEDSTRELIVVPRNEDWLAEAEFQLDEYGTLSGQASSFSADEFIKAVVGLMGVEDPELLAELDAKIAEADKVYVLQPMRERLDASQAAWNFWLCGLGVSFGLILCCSGGPSIVCCIFCPAPALISLIGYPMRYGRGGNFTKLVYLLIGGALTATGYHFLIVQGQLGSPNGLPIMQGIGFSIMFIGFAGMLSIPMQLLTRKLIGSVEPSTSRKNDKRLSYEAACGMTAPSEDENFAAPTYITRTPPEPSSLFDEDSAGDELDDVDFGLHDSPLAAPASRSAALAASTQYVDPELVAAGVWGMPGELQAIVESLRPLGFADPLDVQWDVAGQIQPAAIQLGCQNMVVSDVAMMGDEVSTRLISILHDGMAVITVSNNAANISQQRVGENGHCIVAAGKLPIEMISEHLEATVSIAEARDTSVVRLDASEMNHVCQFGRRVFAEIQTQSGELDQQFDPQSYGRFQSPVQAIVGDLVSV